MATDDPQDQHVALAELRENVARAAAACDRLQAAHDRLLADHDALKTSHDKLVQYIVNLAAGFNDHTNAISTLHSHLGIPVDRVTLQSPAPDGALELSGSQTLPSIDQPEPVVTAAPVASRTAPSATASLLKHSHTKATVSITTTPQSNESAQKHAALSENIYRDTSVRLSSQSAAAPARKQPRPHSPPQNVSQQQPKPIQHQSRQTSQSMTWLNSTPNTSSQKSSNRPSQTPSHSLQPIRPKIPKTPVYTSSANADLQNRSHSLPQPKKISSQPKMTESSTPTSVQRKRHSTSPDSEPQKAARTSQSSVIIRRPQRVRAKHVRPEPLPLKRLEQLTVTLNSPVPLYYTIGALSENEREDLIRYIGSLANAPKDQFLLRYTGFPEPFNSTYNEVHRYTKPQTKDPRYMTEAEKQTLGAEISMMKELGSYQYVWKKAMDALPTWLKSEKVQEMNILDFIQYHCTVVFRLKSFDIPNDPDDIRKEAASSINDIEKA